MFIVPMIKFCEEQRTEIDLNHFQVKVLELLKQHELI